MRGGNSHPYNSVTSLLCSFQGSSSASHQTWRKGSQPTFVASQKIIPTRLTVAGDASSRSSASNIMVMRSVILMISPDMRQSFLLSSSTVFMFSIQTASTGPSNMTHWRSLPVSMAQFRKMTASTPSDHSCVLSSKLPYSWPALMDLGFIVCMTTFSKGSPRSAHVVIASAKQWTDEVLPEQVWPTIMTPCRTSTIS